MGHDLELDFDKYCVVDRSPKTVLPSPRHSHVKKRKVRKKPKCEYNVLLSENKKFSDISFSRYRSASCRAVQLTRFEVNEGQKRGSVYQSSNEVSKMSKIREIENEGRKKIEYSSRSDNPISFQIVDSLCNSDDDHDLIGSLPSTRLDMSRNSIRNGDRISPSIPLHKSLSARLALPHSPPKTKSDSSKSISPKTHISPFKKMFDPFTKSKSQKSPLGSAIEEPNVATSSLTKTITLKKSLLDDFSNTNGDSQSLKKDLCSSMVSSCSSPAHLHGFLKLRNKNGVPYFEFFVNNPNDVLVAKTWKMKDCSNWVYTFYAAQNRRKSNASVHQSKDNSSKRFIMVAQMQMSCYLCTEVINSGSFDNSMLTEFVLYDITRPRKYVSQTPESLDAKESSSQETHESNELNDREKVNGQCNSSSSSPWPVAELCPDLETAAIVVQFPTEKNDDLADLSRVKTTAKASVVIPSANHGLPSGKSRGPSPLLDRWRSGGGCDCGGWDMGCPLIVFDSSNIQKEEACKTSAELLLKGSKENTPALTMKVNDAGHYVVDFHAQLSSLQAFSICVAILRSTEASIAMDKVKQCDPLRVLIDEKVKHLIDSVAEDVKSKPSKNFDQIPSSFVVNPPFSPMSRA